eukprot:351612-Chlamydomonas_euryale.AAC.7
MGRAPGMHMQRSAVVMYQPGMAAASAMGKAAIAHGFPPSPLGAAAVLLPADWGQLIASAHAVIASDNYAVVGRASDSCAVTASAQVNGNAHAEVSRAADAIAGTAAVAVLGSSSHGS